MNFLSIFKRNLIFKLKKKIDIDKDIFLNQFLIIFFRNYEFWKKKGFNFIKKKWLLNIFKKKGNIIIKNKGNHIKGRVVNLLENGGIKVKSNNKILEVFYGDQIT